MWAAIAALAVASYGFKALGPVVVSGRRPSPRVATALALLPIPMLAAIVVVGTFASGHDLRVDARVAGVVVAAVLVWRRAPFLVVILAAAATTALLRAA